MNEDDITYCVKEYLQENRWEIISYNPPGGHGGTIIDFSSLKKDRSKSWQIPDILAYKNKMVLLIECKPRYNEKDVKKLNKIFHNETILKKLENLIQTKLIMLNLMKKNNKLYLFKAIAFTGKIITLDDFITFHVNEDNIVSVHFGENIEPQIKKVFNN